MPHADASLAVGLRLDAELWVMGACRVHVVAGTLWALGAELGTGTAFDVMSPPFDGAIPLVAKRGEVLHHVHCGESAALLGELSRGQTPPPDTAPHCLLRIEAIPELAGYLDDYSCGSSSQPLEPWSLAVPGACFLLRRQQRRSPDTRDPLPTGPSSATRLHSTMAVPAVSAALIPHEIPTARSKQRGAAATPGGASGEMRRGAAAGGPSTASGRGRAEPSPPSRHSAAAAPTAASEATAPTAAAASAGACRAVNRLTEISPEWEGGVRAMIEECGSGPTVFGVLGGVETETTAPWANVHESVATAIVAAATSAPPAAGISPTAHASWSTVPRIVITGPKGAGKSTFARYVCNRLLTTQRFGPPAHAGSRAALLGGGALSVPGTAACASSAASPAHAVTLRGPRLTGGVSSAAPLSSVPPFSPVAWLDIDLGQPEHTIPGVISLSLVRAPIVTPPHARTRWCSEITSLGAGRGDVEEAAAGGALAAGHYRAATADFSSRSGAAPTPSHASPAARTHPAPLPPGTAPSSASQQTVRWGLDSPVGSVLAMRFFGSTSPKADPAAFIAAAGELAALYRSLLLPVGVPLVVNTHGWVRGVGLATNQAVIDAVGPTHLFHLEAGVAEQQLQQQQLRQQGAQPKRGRGGKGKPYFPFTLPGTLPFGASASNLGAGSPLWPGTKVCLLTSWFGASPGPGSTDVGAGREGEVEVDGDVELDDDSGAREAAPLPRPSPCAVAAADLASSSFPPSSGFAAGGDVSGAAVAAPAAASAAASDHYRRDSQKGEWELEGEGAAGEGGQPPSRLQEQGPQLPRASRSPGELRSMRLAAYLLSGLVPAVPRGCKHTRPLQQQRQRILPGTLGGQRAASGEGVGAGDCLASADDPPPQRAIHGTAQGQRRDEAEMDHLCQQSSSTPAALTTDVGSPRAAAGQFSSSSSSTRPPSSSPRDCSRPRDGSQSVVSAQYSSSSRSSSSAASSTPHHCTRDAVCALFSSVRSAVGTVYWRVLGERQEARAPVSGMRSPAFALQHAVAAELDLRGISLCPDASWTLDMLVDSRPAGDWIEGFRGQVVGLLCSDSHPAHQIGTNLSLSSSSSAPVGGGVVRRGVSSLPCLGLGYVTAVDLLLGTLSLVTPVPQHALRRVDVVVSWCGLNDMPPQLLYRSSPAGDSFAVVSSSVAPSVVAAAKANAANRKNLKRTRLGR